MDSYRQGPAHVVDDGPAVRAVRRSIRLGRTAAVAGTALVPVAAALVTRSGAERVAPALAVGLVMAVLVVVRMRWAERRRSRVGRSDTVVGVGVVPGDRWWRPWWRPLPRSVDLVLTPRGVGLGPGLPPGGPAGRRWGDVDRLEIERRRRRPLVVVVVDDRPAFGLEAAGGRDEVADGLRAALDRAALGADHPPSGRHGR